MHVEGFVVCMFGKMAQDVGMVHVEVLWWHSHLVCLVFEGTIPTCACLYLAKKFVTCVCCFFFCFFFCLFVAVIGSLSNLASQKLLEVHMSRVLISGKVLQTHDLVASVTVSEPYM